jgi:predicted permease
MGFDFRYALRMLQKRPWFSFVVVLTIGLGIAATTTAFSVVHAVLLSPLPYPAPDRLVYVWEHNIARGQDRNVVSPLNYIAWRERATSFESMAAFLAMSATITGDGEPERVGSVLVTADFFDILGAVPMRGRLFHAGEDRAEAARVVVLGENFWRRRYGGDAGIVGRTITLNDRPAEVVGILPASFQFDVPGGFGFTGTYDVWAPFPEQEAHRTWGGRYLTVIGRLAAGNNLDGAQRSMAALSQRLVEEFPDDLTGWTVNVVPMREQVVGDVSRALLVIFGAVSFVLLIACANVANLLLTRASERHQEVAVRVAMGASRVRIARQLIAESVALAAVGGGLGVLLSAWGVAVLRVLNPDIPRLETVALNGPVLAFAIGITVFTGLLFGLAPVIHVVRSNLAIWLRGRAGDGGRREAQRMRGALVVTEIALSLMLLIGAGLLGRSLLRLINVGVGFDTDRLLVATVELPSVRYENGPEAAVFFEDLVDRVQRIDGVEAASAITFAPLSGPASATSFWPNDRPVPPAGDRPSAEIRWIHRDYHRAMDIPVLLGRPFNETDGPAAPLRVVISEALQREIWPNENPIGRTLTMPWDEDRVAEVIGVVRDIKHGGPNEVPRSMIYWNHVQFRDFNVMTIVARAERSPLALLPAIRAQLADMDPTLPLYAANTMDENLSAALTRARFAAVSLGVFATVALVLALIGIYGVMSYATGQRINEFGVRLALGAHPGHVVGLVLRQGIVLISVAVGLGVAGALILSRVLQNLVFEVDTLDPLTFVTMVVILALTALAACWIPAHRASVINPVRAMRAD